MADVMDVPPGPLLREDRRRDRSAERKDRTLEDRRQRDRETREEREDRPPRREYNNERKTSQERLGGGGGGGGGERRERERDHKRRKSPTPPAYRDRRHSPPLRRSPGYNKRSRRDDEFEGGGRRGVAAAGAVAGEDNGRLTGFLGEGRTGGMGGRGSGFGGDERLQGRQGGRSGPSMFEIPGPHELIAHNLCREGLMSYKQFIAELEDDILPGEAERRYDEYKTEFITTQKRSFFEQHKDDDWLREKYDPARLEAVLVRRNENAKILAKELLAELQGSSLDVGPSARGSVKEESEDDGDMGAKGKRQSRSTKKSQEINAAPKAPAGSSDPKRVLKDIELCQSLIRKLDSEKGIEGNILAPADQQNVEGDRSISTGSFGPIVIVRSGNQVKGLEGIELLDVMLTYMWRVHSVDYYGMVELKEPPRRLRHIRGTVDPKNVGEDPGFGEWEKKLESMWQARLQSGDLIEKMLGREKLDSTANEALDPFVRKIRDEKYGWKYGCGAKGCTKLFHGPEFVHKHLKLKHSDLVSDVVAKAREELYFQNYMSDPEAPGTTQAVSSQPGQGPGVREEEPRFDRGGREEEPRFDRGGPEHSPGPRDFPPLGGGIPPYEGGGQPQAGHFDGDSMDAPMFDRFNGPPMHGLPGGLFVPDMPGPPQVLMPVPGAGPLGPFVPAPPEIAMRFLREGPTPFHPGAFVGGFDGDGNGMPRGRKRLPVGGPMMGGGLLDVPPMMMPPPHAMRHDPRSVRSYHDLDAPEDEVTVIDYRSL
ncbi:unnamed protein product [Sphagnum troendelagicum]|uniref:C2H2-type domain-containing protein n=1 Tax=Sphagnum troendelagicum TaxID=128251 RepID=A0ABP0TY78_9BRYO